MNLTWSLPTSHNLPWSVRKDITNSISLREKSITLHISASKPAPFLSHFCWPLPAARPAATPSAAFTPRSGRNGADPWDPWDPWDGTRDGEFFSNPEVKWWDFTTYNWLLYGHNHLYFMGFCMILWEFTRICMDFVWFCCVKPCHNGSSEHSQQSLALKLAYFPIQPRM